MQTDQVEAMGPQYRAGDVVAALIGDIGELRQP